ncbi:MAG: glycerol kinase GlpK [Clostridiaceae bacterium]|nr:glycerol kinase GlpK [Clostridiaceae bacterium]
MKTAVVSLDQGTTSSRAILFGADTSVIATAQKSFRQIYPQPAWVEHDPYDILSTTVSCFAEAFADSGLSPCDISAIGITNQRETTVVWDRVTGKPVYNAIVWQCRRTAPIVERLREMGLESTIHRVTGLVPDAYFSATKLAWILENVPGVRERADRGELCAGTVDSWLIWNLTDGHVHATDYSNASRTMLFDIDRLCWDETMCKALHIPMSLLPEARPSSGDFGVLAEHLPGLETLAGIPIRGCAGDQPASLFGQCCFAPGEAKNTYGTGCFLLQNTGSVSPRSKNGLLTSVAWQLDGKTTYAIEGSVFNAGSSIQWLRDELGLISSAHECDILAETVPDAGGIYFVSAFTGLGAPHWDMYARGAIVGLTRGTAKAHLCRAALEGIAYQTADLVRAMAEDGCILTELRVDGGASRSDVMMRFQADVLGLPVRRPAMTETTAAGAAYLAGLSAGVWRDTDELLALYRTERTFYPENDASASYARWQQAIGHAKGWATP